MLEWALTLGSMYFDEAPQVWLYNYTYKSFGIATLGWFACGMTMAQTMSTIPMVYKAAAQLQAELVPLPMVGSSFVSNILWTVMGLCLGNQQVFLSSFCAATVAGCQVAIYVRQNHNDHSNLNHFFKTI